MISRIKNIILSLAATSVFAITLTMPAISLAVTPQDSLCAGANDLIVSSADQPGACKKATSGDNNGEKKVNDLISQIINILSVVVGVVAVIMIIVGGFRYITSAGSPERTKGAKNTILYALIGLVIVALAQIIVKFVLNKTTSEASKSPPASQTSTGNPIINPPAGGHAD